MSDGQFDALLQTWKARWEAFRVAVIAPLGLRWLVMVAVAAYFLSYDWKLARAMGFSLGIVCAILAVVHWARKVLHPYLDVEKFAEKAAEDPVASAYVVLGVLAASLGFGAMVIFVAVR